MYMRFSMTFLYQNTVWDGFIQELVFYRKHKNQKLEKVSVQCSVEVFITIY